MAYTVEKLASKLEVLASVTEESITAVKLELGAIFLELQVKNELNESQACDLINSCHKDFKARTGISVSKAKLIDYGMAYQSLDDNGGLVSPDGKVIISADLLKHLVLSDLELIRVKEGLDASYITYKFVRSKARKAMHNGDATEARKELFETLDKESNKDSDDSADAGAGADAGDDIEPIETLDDLLARKARLVAELAEIELKLIPSGLI